MCLLERVHPVLRGVCLQHARVRAFMHAHVYLADYKHPSSRPIGNFVRIHVGVFMCCVVHNTQCHFMSVGVCLCGQTLHGI